MGRPVLLTASLLLFLLIPFISGCPKNIPPPKNQIEDPTELRAAVDARFSSFQSARFKNVVLDYFGKGDRVKVKQLILVMSPTYLRVQTRMPASDEIMSLLVSDGQQFSMHRRDTNEYFSGTASKENIAKLLPIELSAADVSRVMLGSAPWDRFDEQSSPPTLSWDGSEGAYKYKVDRNAGGELRMWVRHTDYAVVKMVETNTSGDEVYSYSTDDWKRYGNRALPEFRRFEWPDRDLDFSMEVGETQLDVELPESLFELPPPAGSRETRME